VVLRIHRDQIERYMESDNRDWQFSIASLLWLTVAVAVATSVYVWAGRGGFVDGLLLGGPVGSILGQSWATMRTALGRRTRRLRFQLGGVVVGGCIAAAWVHTGFPGGFMAFALVLAGAIVVCISAEISAVAIRRNRLRRRGLGR